MDNPDALMESFNPLNLLSQKLSTSESPLEDLSLQDSVLTLDDLCFPGETKNSCVSNTFSQFSGSNPNQTFAQNVTESRISPSESPNGSLRSLDVEDGNSGEDPFGSNPLPVGGSLIGGNRMTRRTKEVAKFQCGDCSFVTSKLYVFNEHVATHKNNEKEHECPVCQQKFKYKQSVKKHMMKHQGITPYHCLICDYKTNSHSSLEVHQRAHSGEKPFVCKSCGMRFAQNSQLRVHIQYHSNANNPYKCELCDYQSPNYYKLTRHMKVHRERPYACDMCNKKFMLPYQLRNHIATHSKVTQSIASSSSATTSSQVEEKTHRDLMTCIGCMTVFTNRENYLKHIKGCPVMAEPNIIVETPPVPPYTSDLRSVNIIKARNTTFASMEAGKSSKKFAPIAPKKTSSSEKAEKAASSSMLPVTCVTTEIRHADSTVSKILHIPPFKGWDGSKPSPGSTNVAIKRPSANVEDETSDLSSPSTKLSKAVNKLSFLSESLNCETFEEHLGESQVSPLINGKLDFPEDTVVINPEAVPMENPLQNFNVEIPAPDFGSQFGINSAVHSNISSGSFSTVSESSSKSEHSSSSPVISPPVVGGNNHHRPKPSQTGLGSYPETGAESRETKLAILEEQMGSIIDKLWLKFQTNSESSNTENRSSKSPKPSNCLTPRQQMKHWFKENQSGFKALQDLISGDDTNDNDDGVLDLSQPVQVKTEILSPGVLEYEALDLSSKPILDLSISSPLDLSIKEPPQLANASIRKLEKPEYNRNSEMETSVVSANGRKNTFFGSSNDTNRVSKVSRVLSEDQAIIKTDNPERPFKCGYCGKQFIQSSHIRVHLQYHVNAGNPFRCSDCSYTSASKYKLNLHVKVHKERRFQCEHCSSKFTLNCRLNQHVKLAHGEHLPYKCAICNVTFSSTNLLSWHVVNKHPFAQNVTPEVLSSSIGDEKLDDDLAASIEEISDSIQ